MKKGNEAKQARSERIAKKLSEGIIQTQRRWADFMHDRVGRYSLKTQKLGFIVAGLLFGCYCLYLIVTGFSAKGRKQFELSGTIPFPQLEQRERILDNASDSLIVSTLKDFYQKRDSLMKSDPQQWQWVVDNRPGLLDSIDRLESYLSEKVPVRP